MADSSTKANTTRKHRKEPGPAIARALMEARSILLFGEINSKLSKRVISQLIAFDQLDSSLPIRMYVNSPGGAVTDGLAIYDWMRFVKAPVQVICTGLAASAATLVLSGAAKGGRFALPNARLMIHQPRIFGQLTGAASDLEIEAKEIIRMRRHLNEILAEATGRSLEQIEKDVHRDYWMSAEESKEYGLLDAVLTSAEDLPEA